MSDHASISKNFRLDASLLERLKKWREEQEFPPSETAVVEAALKAFLDLREKRKK
ncbi:MAG: hypothetical protein IPO08_22120 [Xanthomonadales bacterium]|nr:hypothetical protein [Xanthomonadales bacterium]